MIRNCLGILLVTSFTGLAAAVAPTPAASQPVPVAADVVSLDGLSDALRGLSLEVAPSVVQVFVAGFGPIQSSAPTGESLLPRRRGSGSGVILSADGYIVTNYHVIEGAERVRVLLSPRLGVDRPQQSILRSQGDLLGAQVVGFDAETDLAVLKVNRTGLPALPLADSDELGPGDLVLAFGSPLGLENTVTLGVVSSVARQLKTEDPMVYIQTDATINPGNSGGPLVDTAGRVVGINTMIYTQSGGSEGIGFAAPSNIVKNVFDQIVASGRVRRGEIGIVGQTITPLMGEALGLNRSWGVVAGDVKPGSPAHLSGVQPGDVILSLDGKTMENGRQLDVNVYRRTIGDVVTLEIQRGRDRITKRVPVIEREDDPLRFQTLADREKNLVPQLGILVLDLTPEIQRMLPPLRRESGVVVAGQSVNAPVWGDGFEPGDVIHSLNGVAVKTLAEFRERVDSMSPGSPAAIQIERRGEFRYLLFTLE